MPRVALLVSLFLVGGCTATSPAPFEASGVRAEIEANNRVFGEGFREDDADRIAALYTADARFFEPDSTVRVGRDAIRAYWQASLAFISDMTLTTLSLEGTREVLYETGNVDTTIDTPEGQFVQRDKYVNVWRRQPDGTYRIAIDMWNGRPE